MRSRGIEVEGKADPVAGLNLIAAYSYTDIEITKGDNEGKSPSNMPEHMASLWADYTFQGALEGFGFGAGVRYFGESFGTDDNTLSLPDYALVDATMFYTRQHAFRGQCQQRPRQRICLLQRRRRSLQLR